MQVNGPSFSAKTPKPGHHSKTPRPEYNDGKVTYFYQGSDPNPWVANLNRKNPKQIYPPSNSTPLPETTMAKSASKKRTKVQKNGHGDSYHSGT